jgi:hypothetical protein
MQRQSSVSANYASLMPVWDQFKLIAHLAERTTIQVQHATRVSADLCAWRRGLQKLRLLTPQLRPRWSMHPRSACVQSGGTIVTKGVITLLSTWFALLIRLASTFPQGERQPCQT